MNQIVPMLSPDDLVISGSLNLGQARRYIPNWLLLRVVVVGDGTCYGFRSRFTASNL
jgi:hypothetical protein